MTSLRPFLLLAALLIPLGVYADTLIQNTTYTSGQSITVSDSGTITANTDVTVSTGAIVTYVAATRVTLGPGFTAQSGSDFRAYIDPNAGDPNFDGDNDGIPDVIEHQLGTDPNSPAQMDTGNQLELQIHRPQ